MVHKEYITHPVNTYTQLWLCSNVNAEFPIYNRTKVTVSLIPFYAKTISFIFSLKSVCLNRHCYSQVKLLVG